MTELERIFHDALEVPPSHRAGFVENACRGNPELAAQIESLLRYHQEPTAQFAAAIEPAAAEFSATQHYSSLPPGTALGPYHIERKLGEGGMGAVYLAEDPRLHRKVAIKVIRHRLGDGGAARVRFHREARSAAALAHANIAVLHDFGETSGMPWLVMEYVPGWPLRSRLRDGPLGEALIRKYANQLASALEHAHSRGVIHRDIKPENILLTEDGNVKVIDFGIATMLRDPAHDPDSLGTPAYMAPELLSGSPASEACDVYSIGAVLYEMAYGIRPSSGSASTSSDQRNPSLSPALAAFIQRCLATEPSRRWPDAARLLAALRTLPEADPTPSVAIADLVNLSGDTAHDWLGTGIAETLAARFAKLPGVRVTSRARVRHAAKELDDPTAIGQSLEATHVITGSFQCIAKRVRIAITLTATTPGSVILAETVDGNYDELFDLQDRTAALVAGCLPRPGMAGPPVQPPADTRNMSAFEHYTKGRRLMWEMGPRSLTGAIAHFEQALELDPGYAHPRSALGTTYALLFLRTSNVEDVQRASVHLERAIAIDPELAEPYPWLAYVRIRKNDPEGAFAAGRKGVELQPDLPEAQYFCGGLHYMISESGGRVASGVKALAEAIRLQPRFHPAWILLGAAAAFGGRHDSAIRILSSAIELENWPELTYRFVGAHTLRATALLRQRRWSESRQCFEEAITALNHGPEHLYKECFLVLSACGLGDIALRLGEPTAALNHYRHGWRIVKESPRIAGSARLLLRAALGLSAAYVVQGETARARQLYEDCIEQLPSVSTTSTVTIECGLAQLHLCFAVAALRLGETQRAEAHLQSAAASQWQDLPWLLGDPELDPLRHTAPYRALVADLEAEPDWDAPVPDLPI